PGLQPAPLEPSLVGTAAPRLLTFPRRAPHAWLRGACTQQLRRAGAALPAARAGGQPAGVLGGLSARRPAGGCGWPVGPACPLAGQPVMKLKSLVGLPRDLRALYGGVAGLLTPPHKRLFCLTALWAAGFSLLELLLAAAVLPYFDCLNGAGCGVVGSGAERLSLHPLLLFSLLLILLLSIKTGAEVLLTWSLTGFHQSVQRDLVLRLLAAFLHQSWPAFRERHRAD